MKQRFSSLDVKVSLKIVSLRDKSGNQRQVIAQELSQTLCTLRLANIYDLSSVGKSPLLVYNPRLVLP